MLKKIYSILLILLSTVMIAQTPVDTVCIQEGPSALAVPFQPGLSYSWSTGPGRIIGSQDSNVVWIDWSLAAPGLYPVAVSAQAGPYACSGDTSEAWVLVQPSPEARALFPEEVCADELISVVSLVNGDFIWSNGSTDRERTFRASSDTSLRLIAFNTNCGADTLDINIRVNPPGVAAINMLPDTTLQGSRLNLEFQGQSKRAELVEWYLNDEFIGQGAELDINFEQSGYQTIKQYVGTGACRDSALKRIYVEDEFKVFFPTAFTPNGDGRNDRYRFEGVGIANYEAAIYNRWGELVYSWNDQSRVEAWDGNLHGEASPSGSYVCKVLIEDLSGRQHSYLKNIQLLR